MGGGSLMVIPASGNSPGGIGRRRRLQAVSSRCRITATNRFHALFINLCQEGDSKRIA
jgi:hypothetical protein